MPGIRALFSALTMAACAVGIAACGGDEKGPIPTDTGEQLLAQLDQIETAVQAGDCDQAQATALAFADSIDGLPPEVDGELRNGLVDASANLEALSEDPEQCTADTGATGETGVTPDPEVPVEPPTDQSETNTPPEDAAQEPDGQAPQDEGGSGNGNPGGGGNNEGGDDSSGGIGSDG